jgi:Recombination endonuclease VII
MSQNTSKEIAKCHPERPRYALGLCRRCYRKQDYHKNKEILRPVLKARSKRYYQRHKDEIKSRRGSGTNSEWMKWMRRKRYGLNHEEFQALIAKQNGLCAICEKEIDVPNVDHDHISGQVRGILCRKCNHGLGCFQDDPRLLVEAVDYLADFLVPPAPELRTYPNYEAQGIASINASY